MKFLLYCFYLIVFVIPSIGQKGFVKYLEIKKDEYQLKHDEDGNLTEAILIFEDLEAIYYKRKKGLIAENQSQQRLWELMNKGEQISDQEQDELSSYGNQRTDGSIYYYLEIPYDKVGEFNHFNFSESILTSRLGDSKKKSIVKEDIPEQSWKLYEEGKQLGKFFCKKATVNFRGRNYIAWYALDIPVSLGPYKMYGLPGLILELSTDDGFYIFKAVQIEIPYKGKYDAKLPNAKALKKDKTYTLEAYIAMIDKKRQNHIRSLEAEGIEPTIEFNDLEKIFWVPK